MRPGRVGLCARETRCVCVCVYSITFFRGAGPGARGDSDRARLESHERAIARALIGICPVDAGVFRSSRQ